MKYLMLLLVAFTSLATAHTITYDNGDVYTVADDEYVFVAKKDTLWTQNIYNNGKTVQFKKVGPWTKVDYVPVDNGTDDSMQAGSHEWCKDYVPPDTGVDDEAPGSHAWCKAYIPWSEGYTFGMQLWQRACDTNNDNKYGCGDEKYDASDDGNACPAG